MPSLFHPRLSRVIDLPESPPEFIDIKPKFESWYRELGEVNLPQPIGRDRVLMMPFKLEDVEGTLPDSLARWRSSIASLVSMGPCQEGTAYLTIDEALVKKGEYHRRPGLHVDGWSTEVDMGSWGGPENPTGGAWGGGREEPSRRPRPEKKTSSDKGKPKKKPKAEAALEDGFEDATTFEERDYTGGIGMLMVSNVSACRMWDKNFSGEPENYGDCEHLRDQFPEAEATLCKPLVAYHMGPLTVHESLPVTETTERQFVRISMPSTADWPSSCTANPLGILPGGRITAPRPQQFTDYGNRHIIIDNEK